MRDSSDKFYWYEDVRSRIVIIGERGGCEYKVDMFHFEAKYFKQKIKLGRELTAEEIFKICIIESQYVGLRGDKARN